MAGRRAAVDPRAGPLAVGPFPLWRPLDPDAAPEPTPWATLPGTLREWAGIYVAMGRLGHSQAEVDEMELWVIATILDANAPTPSGDYPTGGEADDETMVTEAEFHRQSMALIQQRLAEAEEAGIPSGVDEPPTIPT